MMLLVNSLLGKSGFTSPTSLASLVYRPPPAALLPRSWRRESQGLLTLLPGER